MKSPAIRVFAALVLLVLAGVARMPVERKLTDDFREQGLLAEPLDLSTTRKLGQGFWSVTLGGLRSLVSTILNLRAFVAFENNQWDRLASLYDTIVQLSPHSFYYWDTGHWHMAYNAASEVMRDSDLPPLRAEAERRQWVERGVAFLEQGARLNPGDWRFWNSLGVFHAHPFRQTDHAKAAEAFGRAVATGEAPTHVRSAHIRSLARAPGRVDEARPLLRDFWQDHPRYRTPTLKSLHFVLEHRADPGRDLRELAIGTFGTPEKAWQQLGNYFLNDPAYPMNGVRTVLRRLEKELGIPEQRSVFHAQ